MGINLQGLYNQTHQFSAGIVNIDAPFVGNVLAIELTTKPEYVPNSQIIGYLYQHYQTASKGYALRSGKDIVSLELPETESLDFVPTPYLSDSYTLSIKYATIGAVIDGQNTIGLPQQILDLPNNFKAIDLQIEQIEAHIQEVEASIPNWETLSGKPSTFAPSSHQHVKADITDLSLDWEDITAKPESFPPSLHTHSVEQITGLSVAKETVLLSQNSTLESKKSYLATVNNLICSLPANPAIGDWIELANGNFSSFRVNHGNTSQAILNNQTSSSAGSTDSGIILKPYGYICLIYVGSSLWVSTQKYRSVNNWTPPTISTSLAEYTPSFLSGSYSEYGTSILNIKNGQKTANGSLNIGALIFPNPSRMLLTFQNPIAISQVRLWTGVGNEPQGSQASWSVGLMRIFNGSSTGNLIASASPQNLNGIEQVFNFSDLPINNQFVFEFSSTTGIGVIEIEIFANTITGGEISVV